MDTCAQTLHMCSLGRCGLRRRLGGLRCRRGGLRCRRAGRRFRIDGLRFRRGGLRCRCRLRLGALGIWLDVGVQLRRVNGGLFIVEFVAADGPLVVLAGHIGFVPYEVGRTGPFRDGTTRRAGGPRVPNIFGPFLDGTTHCEHSSGSLSGNSTSTHRWSWKPINTHKLHSSIDALRRRGPDQHGPPGGYARDTLLPPNPAGEGPQGHLNVSRLYPFGDPC